MLFLIVNSTTKPADIKMNRLISMVYELNL